MVLTWRITSLKVNFSFPLSDVLYSYDSLHQSGSLLSTLVLQSSPQNKQCCNHLNFVNSHRLCRMGDNRSLEHLRLLSSLFKRLSMRVFELYVERQFLWATKLSWLKLRRLLHKESFLNFLASCMERNLFFEILCTSEPLWQLLKCPFKYALLPFRYCNLENTTVLVNIEECTWQYI